MNIGVSLYLTQKMKPDEALEMAAAAGFTQAEFPGEGMDDFWRMDPARVRAMLAQHGLCARTAHSPGAGWNNDAPDDAVRRASLDAASSVFAAAAAMGVEAIIVHPNSNDTHGFVASDWNANIARSVESLKVLAERAAAHGLKLAVENLPRRGTPRPAGSVAEVLSMIDGLGPHVGLCVDIGHANSNGLRAADELRAGAGRVYAIHVQDNDGKGEDQHLEPGAGTVDWPATLAAIERYAPQAAVNFEIPSRGGERAMLERLAALRKTWTGR